MAERKFFVFSLSEKDEAFDHKDMKKATKWLEDKQYEPNPVCYFRENSPREVPSGAIILFSFDAKLFGQATLKGTKKAVPQEVQEDRRKAGEIVYKYFVHLEPTKENIIIFSNPRSKKEITKKVGITFNRVFTYLSHSEYQKILKLVRKR